MLTEVKKHSGAGIAALIIGILDILGACLIIVLSLTITYVLFVNLTSIFVGILCIVGVTLGIIGIVQQVQNKIYAIIGLVLNALVLFSVCGLWATSDMRLI